MRTRTKQPTGPFALWLVECRGLLGLTQREIGHKLGIPMRTWQDYEREVRTPAPWVKKLILRELDRLCSGAPARRKPLLGVVE